MKLDEAFPDADNGMSDVRSPAKPDRWSDLAQIDHRASWPEPRRGLTQSHAVSDPGVHAQRSRLT